MLYPGDLNQRVQIAESRSPHYLRLGILLNYSYREAEVRLTQRISPTIELVEVVCLPVEQVVRLQDWEICAVTGVNQSHKFWDFVPHCAAFFPNILRDGLLIKKRCGFLDVADP